MNKRKRKRAGVRACGRHIRKKVKKNEASDMGALARREISQVCGAVRGVVRAGGGGAHAMRWDGMGWDEMGRARMGEATCSLLCRNKEQE